MKKVILWTLVLMLLLAGCTSAEPSKPKETIKPNTQLLEQYPEYFGLDAANGLDVYVWQMAKNSYSFGVLPHQETPREALDPALWELKSTTAAQMRGILASYEIDKEQIHIIPWQNLLSSYIAECWVVREGEDVAAKQKDYVKFVEMMLFVPQEDTPVLADMVFDADGDGSADYCTLSAGPTSGVFSFTFRVFEPQSETPKYEQTFQMDHCQLSFRYDFINDASYIKAVTLTDDPQTSYYRPVIENGQVTLEKVAYTPPDITVYPDN